MASGGSSVAFMFGDVGFRLARGSGSINTAFAYISTAHAPKSECNQPHASAVLSAVYRLWTFIAASIRWNSVRMVAGERLRCAARIFESVVLKERLVLSNSRSAGVKGLARFVGMCTTSPIGNSLHYPERNRARSANIRCCVQTAAELTRYRIKGYYGPQLGLCELVYIRRKFSLSGAI
jgi:hypothetical protein